MMLNPAHRTRLELEASPFIGGRFEAAVTGQRVAHINPSTGAQQAILQLGGAREIERAVSTALDAQRAWAAMPVFLRIQCFKRLHELMQSRSSELAVLGARESGIPVSLDLGFLARCWVDHYMGWIDKIDGEAGSAYPMPGHNFTRREPYGVVGVIIPWNGPQVAIAMTVMPAIAAGNAVVLKPPTLAPFVALRFAQLMIEAGFPAGLLNVVPGEAEAGEALVAHPAVGKISFTGGENVARRVMEVAARGLKPLALELGGKSANIVFADADLDAAIAQAVHGALGLSGQGCVNPTRLLVQRECYDDVVARVAAMTNSIVVGDPLDPGTQMGPVICESACERILGVIERSRAEGRLVAGGERLGGDLAGGFFIQPTVFADVAAGASLEQNEVFGPVLSITPFATDAEALAIANGTRYGLGAYLHTRDLDRALAFAEQLEAGYVNINGFAGMAPTAPFGGYKQSGFGRVGGWAGVEEYLQTKNVFIARKPSSS
jgi:aldehyde dehydrogenase (NAD+)